MVVDISIKRGRESGVDFQSDSAAAYEKPRDAQRVRAENEKAGAFVKRWTAEQDEALRQAVNELGHRNWMAVAERVPGRDNAQCLQRWNKVLKPGLVKGPWSVDEDNLLMETMLKGYDSWREVAAQIPGRTAKQCRERWRNRLDPNINKGYKTFIYSFIPFTEEEDSIIEQAYEKLGNRWTQIAELLPGRTEDSVKLRWKTLNPNQKTYTKLGRPRLLPTDQIDNPELGYSPGPGSYYSDESKSVTSSTPSYVPSPPSSVESNNQSNQYIDQNNVKAELSSPEALPEPIIGENDSDEEMSSEDIVIFKAFLRGQSSGSMRLDGSFRNLLADLPEDMAKNYPGLAGISSSSSRSLQRGSSISWAPIEATGEAKSQSSRGKLVSMMSLGSVRSVSLRSLTEEDPYFASEGDLNRQLSGMSLIEGMGDDNQAEDNQQLDNTGSSTSHGEYISKMDSFEDAQLIAEAMLHPVVDMTKTSFTEQLNGTGVSYLGSSSNQVVGGSQTEINEALLNEFFNPETEGIGAANGEGVGSATATTAVVSEQDFYNGDVTLDLLSAADRFEI